MTRHQLLPSLARLTVLLLGSAPAFAQSTDERLERLERENLELRRRVDVLAGELERSELGAAFTPLGPSVSGLGAGASKVFSAPEGVVLGGYGESLYKDFAASKDDEIDVLRAVVYVGYRFDERWVFDSEIELEHAVAGDGKDGEVSAEFAFLDGRMSDAWHLRAGLLLVPMGLTNERHEPTAFPSANRPFVERFVLPTTWREIGVGAWGDIGDVSWRVYLVDGFDAQGFTATGLRDGRQGGSEALAEDFALVARADWRATDGIELGASAYRGDAGQGQVGADVATTIVEAHADVRWRALTLRALFAQAELDDVAELNAALGLTGTASVGETLRGGYIELAYDVLDGDASLEPFVRLESYDTQADVPAGFASNPANAVEVRTFGIAYKPHPNIVFKLDYNDFDNDAGTALDQLDVALGFSF